VLRFFVAPLSCDQRTRRRIEAAIARMLYATSGIVGTFQDQGVVYWPKFTSEQPVSCITSSPIPLLGLSERFSA
jgi:hypothetical protein